MPLIIPPGFAQAVYEFSLDGDQQPMVTTVGVDSSGAGGNFVDLANSLQAGFNQTFRAQIPSVYHLERVTLYVGQDGGAPTIFDSTGVRSNGGKAFPAIPQNSCWLIRKRTTLGGRRGRGRFYMPGVAEAQVNNIGQIEAAERAAAQTAVNNWYSTFSAPSVGMPHLPYVLHRSEGFGVEPPPTLITNFVVDAMIATQRQRLRR